MGYWNPVFVLPLLLALTQVGGGRMTCEDDHHCTDNMFCYMSTQTCTSCLQCHAYLRHDKGSCAKEPSQCGNCLDGYETQIFSDGRSRDLCTPMQGSNKPSSSEPQVMLAAEIPWLPFAGVMVVIACGLVTYFVKKRAVMKVNYSTRFHPCDGSLPSSPVAPFPPSSLVPFAPSAPPPFHTEIPDEEIKIIEGYTFGKEDEKYQMAARYKSPVYVNSPDDELASEGQQDVVDGPPPQNSDPTENQSFLIEENTLPSDWTPGPEYENRLTPPSNAGEPLITSFEGILRLNAQALARGAGPSSSTGAGSTGSANHSASSSENVNNITVTNITVINSGSTTTAGVFNVTST